MLFSVYPSDAEELRSEIVSAACRAAGTGGSPQLFTSLHIPENTGFETYLAWMKGCHRTDGLSFVADISPLTFERLGSGINGLNILRECGVCGLRIDFGFSAKDILTLAQTGFEIAVNASTATHALIDELHNTLHEKLTAWHNYYPRPETGLDEAFFASQNTLFRERGIPIYVFIPGEKNFRLPLFKGLPTLESCRYKNTWRNYIVLKKNHPDLTVVCAEGTPYDKHYDWIAYYEHEKCLTIPVTCGDAVFSRFKDKTFTVRLEESASSWRLEGTRSDFVPPEIIRGEKRAKGSLWADLPSLGRYRGEIHIMKKDMPLDGDTVFLGDIASPYRAIVDCMKGGDTIRFVKE